MILVIVHHVVKPSTRAAAAQRIDAVGDWMARAPGFVARYHTTSANDA